MLLPYRYVLGCEFDTALGQCVVSWSEAGVWMLELPRDWSWRPPPSGPRTDVTKLPPPEADLPAFVAETILKVRAHLSERVPTYGDLPLDLGNPTDFERQVLETVRRIPAGETRTYHDVAIAIGRPNSARAVARVLAQNRLPLIIPCHRVVGSGGSLGGYSGPGGVATKTWLLEIEKPDRGST